MGVRILEGAYDGLDGKAVLVDSVTGTAFGPLFESADEAEAFLEWLGGDEARDYSPAHLVAQVARFRNASNATREASE